MRKIFKKIVLLCMALVISMGILTAYATQTVDSPELDETVVVDEGSEGKGEKDGEKSPQTGDNSPAALVLVGACILCAGGIYIVNKTKKSVE